MLNNKNNKDFYNVNYLFLNIFKREKIELYYKKIDQVMVDNLVDD